MVTKGDNRRLARVGEGIREALSGLLVKSVADPRLQWVTVTEVEPSPDLRNARVYYVVTGEMHSRQDAKAALGKATAYLQAEIAKRVKLRFTPKLSFRYDNSFDDAAEIDSLIDAVKDEREAKPEVSTEERLAALIAESEDILVIAHKNPDGDALGSLMGFSRMLRLMGKVPTVYCPDKIPASLQFLPGLDEVTSELDAADEFELTVSLDTADAGLLPPGLPPKEQLGTIAVIDHHATHGDLGDLVIRYEASAVGEMLLDLQKRLVWPIDAAVAECLYTSIVADTGSFRYANTKPSTHRAAAELISLGAKSWKVASALFESNPLHRQRLLASVLKTLQTDESARYASLFCTQKMFKEVGATKEDMDGIINFARSIDTVLVAAIFREEPDGNIKVSFRSKEDYDVASVCAKFGGGGHKNAAGCTFESTTLETAMAKVLPFVQEILRGNG